MRDPTAFPQTKGHADDYRGYKPENADLVILSFNGYGQQLGPRVKRLGHISLRSSIAQPAEDLAVENTRCR